MNVLKRIWRAITTPEPEQPKPVALPMVVNLYNDSGDQRRARLLNTRFSGQLRSSGRGNLEDFLGGGGRAMKSNPLAPNDLSAPMQELPSISQRGQRLARGICPACGAAAMQTIRQSRGMLSEVCRNCGHTANTPLDGYGSDDGGFNG